MAINTGPDDPTETAGDNTGRGQEKDKKKQNAQIVLLRKNFQQDWQVLFCIFLILI